MLEGVIAKGNSFHAFHTRGFLAQLAEPLSKDQRRELLLRIKRHAHSALPQVLVDHDAELYREMLASQSLQDCMPRLWSVIQTRKTGRHLPRLPWRQAILIGIYRVRSTATAIAGAVASLPTIRNGSIDSRGYVSHPDPDIQRTAEEGIRWSSAGRAAHLQGEKKEAIYGLGLT